MRLLAVALVAAMLAGCAVPGSRPPAPTPYFEEVLRAEPFTRLVIEVDHAPDRKPSDAALTHLRMTFANITRKADITLLVEPSLDAAPRSWTGDELVALEASRRTTPHEAPTAVLRVLYPAGDYAGNPGAAGVTIGGPVLGPAVVFLDVLRSMPPPAGGGLLPELPLPEDTVRLLERSTLLHEAGHAIGLVDNGMPMVRDHRDPDGARGAHSANEHSVMYYAVDTYEGLRKTLTDEGRVPDTFDSDDRADIRAAGGR